MKPPLFLSCLFAFLIFSVNVLLGAPVITTVDPGVGPVAGGTTVTIIGSGFTGTLAVTFDSKPATTFSVNSDTLITATSPPHSPQVVSISVTTPSGTSPRTPNSFFTYQGDWLAYVSDTNTNNLSVVNTATNTIIANPGVGPNPFPLAITPDGTKTYVCNSVDNSVSVIDTSTNLVLATITVGLNPSAVAITPDGTKAYVTNFSSSTVSVINTTTNLVIATPTVGANPDAVAITPNGAKAYVSNSTDGTVSVIDTSTNTVIPPPIVVGMNPKSIVITQDGTKAYVLTDSLTGSVAVINTSNDTVIAIIDTGIGAVPNSIAITPNGKKAYVLGGGSVGVINIATNTATQAIIIGQPLASIVITQDGTKAFFLSNNLVFVINTSTDTVATSFGVGLDPIEIVLTPDGKKGYVTNSGDNTISVFDTSTNRVILTITNIGGTNPTAAAITPDQAPLAKFVVNLASAGFPSIFDALASVSPVGIIANYFWDFGDGTTLNTFAPITFHTYAIPGNYVVTLIVTNSAGTSTTQIFTPASSFFSPIFTVSTGVTHNGGPTALATEVITILAPPPPPPPPIPPVPPVPCPPRDLEGHQGKNEFATQTDRINILTWKAPVKGSSPIAYHIYRDRALTELVAVIPANERLRFEEHNRKKGRTYRYFVVSVDQADRFSKPAKVVIKPGH